MFWNDTGLRCPVTSLPTLGTCFRLIEDRWNLHLGLGNLTRIVDGFDLASV
jgi:hypothetical protein